MSKILCFQYLQISPYLQPKSIDIFLICPQKQRLWYSLEVPHWGASNYEKIKKSRYTLIWSYASLSRSPTTEFTKRSCNQAGVWGEAWNLDFSCWACYMTFSIISSVLRELWVETVYILNKFLLVKSWFGQAAHHNYAAENSSVKVSRWLNVTLTLVMLNKLICHTHFCLSANQITWSRLLMQFTYWMTNS